MSPKWHSNFGCQFSSCLLQASPKSLVQVWRKAAQGTFSLCAVLLFKMLESRINILDLKEQKGSLHWRIPKQISKIYASESLEKERDHPFHEKRTRQCWVFAYSKYFKNLLSVVERFSMNVTNIRGNRAHPMPFNSILQTISF